MRYQSALPVKLPIRDVLRKQGLIAAIGDGEDVDDGQAALPSVVQPPVVRGIGVFTHERVHERFVALEYPRWASFWSSYRTFAPFLG